MSVDQPRPRRRVTLADVAKSAGVSTALVSIVMREAPGASQATRERILSAARELGYRPDVRARALASLKPHLIGALFGRAGRFHFELIDGLYAAAETRGWDLVLSALTSQRDEARAIESLHDFRFDALVMLGPPVAEPLLAGQVPVVVVGWHVEHPDVDVVRTDDDRAMQLAVEHLVAFGHRRIAHLSAGSGLVSQARRRGYEQAMHAAGLGSEIRVVDCDGEDQVDGQRGALALVREGELPTGIIAFNDDLAASALNVLRQHDVDVSGQVSVIGFDDSVLARSPTLELTSVRQDTLEMSRLAVDRLIARCNGEVPEDREITLEPTLVVRSSTGPAPA